MLWLGQIGPLTKAMESLAIAVGAGMLLGAFGLGALAYLNGLPRQAIEDRALTDGLAGGIAALFLVLSDLAWHHLVSKLIV